MACCIAHCSSLNAHGCSRFFITFKKEYAESDLRKATYKFHNNVCLCHGFGDHYIGQYPTY